MKVYEVRYNLPACPDDGSQYPVIDGRLFRFKENAVRHASEDARSTVHPVNAVVTVNAFSGEPHPPAVPASGGKMLRRIARTVHGARYDRRRRMRGWRNANRASSFIPFSASGAR